MLQNKNLFAVFPKASYNDLSKSNHQQSRYHRVALHSDNMEDPKRISLKINSARLDTLNPAPTLCQSRERGRSFDSLSRAQTLIVGIHCQYFPVCAWSVSFREYIGGHNVDQA